MYKRMIEELMAPYENRFDKAVKEYNTALMWAEEDSEEEAAKSALHKEVNDLFEEVIDLFSGALEEALDAMELMGWRPVLEFLEI